MSSKYQLGKGSFLSLSWPFLGTLSSLEIIIYWCRSPGHEDSDNMQITIAVDKSEEAGTVRKVERDVDIDNFTVVDQVRMEYQNLISIISSSTFKVFGDDAEKNEEQKNSEDNAGDKPDNVVDLEKVVIKRRDKKDDRKSSDGKDLGEDEELKLHLTFFFLIYFSYQEAKQSHL